MKKYKQKVVLIRHGETEWALAGRHTSFTDLSLTEKGREEASLLQGALNNWQFKQVFSSPLKRAFETCELAGVADGVVVEPDLSEWNYGRYEGLTTAQIQKEVPGWNLFEQGCPEGDSPEEVCIRVDRIIKKVQAIDGDVAVFSHGHLSRVFATRWLNRPIEESGMFVLDTATLNVLGAYHNTPAIVTWNAKINGYL
ncbi:histidine phosphatase family protein [methanotrophic endosymbiont of Bathymodiolus puteoserpentis (Logatchev)]|jgi:probable phosphoglycerate mutase|uniref:histidine phosphatase family protein n=1 Tax=methanotrophic endosymbiont of Bathymodiolus puteoserpentis (Logatchev) TaxID=343235 RepID=UPI0013CB46FB|nr:histidine phosphatase family protein [methanotrophic endosymbiont of Bathymodiolus puteoserpentis (Logatchev)]SHE21976.1 putative phosphoglycerate mutase family protein [methanotrophic endosymbiont of Bathymodiolus puteoserpentis (Logatchev)]